MKVEEIELSFVLLSFSTVHNFIHGSDIVIKSNIVLRIHFYLRADFDRSIIFLRFAAH